MTPNPTAPEPADPPRFTIVISLSPDPVVRYGGRERPPEQRLRAVLKALARAGFRVVSAKPCGPIAAGATPRAGGGRDAAGDD